MKNEILNAHEIHCWVIDLSLHLCDASSYQKWLSEAEKSRADRFLFKELKERYVVSHGVLNRLLEKYLNTNQFEMSFGEYGKPFIKDSFLHFNLSHSNHYACMVFAHFEVGVDIEYMGEDAIIESIFSKEEMNHFDKIESGLKRQAFYGAWVRKESYLKALGYGLSQPIDEAEVGFKTPPEWSFIPIAVSDGYIGCIAARIAPLPTVRWFRWM